MMTSVRHVAPNLSCSVQVCDKPVSDDDTVCPHCGCTFVRECPGCGQEIYIGEEACPNCGQGVCPHCGAAMDDEATICGDCGFEYVLICPECNAEVPATAEKCPNCGLVFLEEEDKEA